MKLKVNRFTDEFKLKVVQEYLDTDVSQCELKKKYNIGGKNCITIWMRKFGLKARDRITTHNGKAERENAL